MYFSTAHIIWHILYIENLVAHLSSLHFQLYKDIWFAEILQICYESLIWLWNGANLSIWDLFSQNERQVARELKEI